jgi:hypothetical protein
VHAVLQALDQLVHAVAAGLHDELAVEDALHGAVAHKFNQVVLVVAQAVERKCRVVLQGTAVRGAG